ncbi:c-type cytochrome biogenesis protein CcmI [Paenochrobactrum sp. BZR 588]|uniref:c-type cytochrome biogenesis protein CcmI n=1 Tax=unclassified Paenochrobactrum TaxID=2639760 RepID=UPI003854B3D5
MEFWLFSACLTVIATLVVLLPLSRNIRTSQTGGQNDLEVYRDQMSEIEADVSRGMIDTQSAEQARLEIARRLLKAEKDASLNRSISDNLKTHKILAFVAVLLVPLLSWGIYSSVGSPDLPSQPLSKRIAVNPERAPVEELVSQAEAHLVENPQDGRGWNVLAPIYLRLGRVDDAINAYRNSIRLNGEDFALNLGLAESLVLKSGGLVTAEAHALFEKAAIQNPDDYRPQFFLARTLLQDGKNEEAKAFLKAFLERSSADAPWRSQIEDAIRRIDGETVPGQAQAPVTATSSAKGPSAADVEAASSMSNDQRKEMIEGMVAGLQAKLQAQSDDLEGWQRLISSYMVMQKPDDAKAALEQALKLLPEDKRSLLLAHVKTLNLEVEGAEP